MEDPQPSRLVLLSDYPGVNEAKRRKNFCGRAGAELERLYLPMAGMNRTQLYVTNVIKCPWTSNKKPDPEQVHACGEHWLPYELRRVQPEIIIVAGSQAIKLFRGKSVTMDHGRPFQGGLKREIHGANEVYWEGWVFPTFNPAAGLRSGDFMTPTVEDFRALPEFCRNPEQFYLNLPHDPFQNPDYQHLEGAADVAHYMGNTPLVDATYDRPGIGMDTETIPSSVPGAPDPAYCVSFSLQPGTGAVIMADDYDGLTELYGWLDAFNPVVFIHNGLFDLPVVDRMELPPHILDNVAKPGQWVDTMIRAYHQRDLPIALKVLAYRELGATVQTFDDVVLPFTVSLVRDWLDRVENHLGGWKHVRKPRQVSLEKRVARIGKDMQTWLTYVSTEELLDAGMIDSDTDIDEEDGKLSNPWRRWKSIPAEMQDAAISAYGPMPVKSIAHVPLPLAIHYAAKDSDLALRLGLGLLQRRMFSHRARVPRDSRFVTAHLF